MTAMHRATVVIPTHTHFATLPYAVKRVQDQGVDDIEIFIIGDGVDDTMRATVRALQAGDPRIRFFDLPKGPRSGELHRDQVLREEPGAGSVVGRDRHLEPARSVRLLEQHRRHV